MGDPTLDDTELRALLTELKARCGISYETLVQRAHCSRGTAQTYLTKPGLERSRSILDGLLDALGPSAAERTRVLELYQLTCPAGPDPATVGWLARVRAAGCTVWEMDRFTPSEATVHTAIGRRHPGSDMAAVGLDSPPPYVPRAHDLRLRAEIASPRAVRCWR